MQYVIHRQIVLLQFRSPSFPRAQPHPFIFEIQLLPLQAQHLTDSTKRVIEHPKQVHLLPIRRHHHFVDVFSRGNVPRRRGLREFFNAAAGIAADPDILIHGPIVQRFQVPQIAVDGLRADRSPFYAVFETFMQKCFYVFFCDGVGVDVGAEERNESAINEDFLSEGVVSQSQPAYGAVEPAKCIKTKNVPSYISLFSLLFSSLLPKVSAGI